MYAYYVRSHPPNCLSACFLAVCNGILTCIRHFSVMLPYTVNYTSEERYPRDTPCLCVRLLKEYYSIEALYICVMML